MLIIAFNEYLMLLGNFKNKYLMV